jgi:DNA-binding transcriptional MerR regulator
MEQYISISEMAEMHNLSRQTLIHYDRIGLFKPSYTNHKGYRYYSIRQIPFLREICFLKSIGIDLKVIKAHFENRDVQEISALLAKQNNSIEQQIHYLKKVQINIRQRLKLYNQIGALVPELYQPAIKKFARRQAVFVPFASQNITKQELHIAYMKAWKIVTQYDVLPSGGFGVIIKEESILGQDHFNGAGVYILVPFFEKPVENLLILPAGEYVCMLKYGMPYDTQHVVKLIHWVREQGYSIAGHIIDACLLDTTFYQKEQKTDLCMLQIPVKSV